MDGEKYCFALTQASHSGKKAYIPDAARYKAPYFTEGLLAGRNSSMKKPAMPSGTEQIIRMPRFW